MNVAINKEAFRNILSQFRGDVAFQTELLRQLFNEMPENYVDELLEELYFERLYTKQYFIVQHSIYKADRKCFARIEDVLAYLNSIDVEGKTHSMYAVTNAANKGTLVAGYYIIKSQGKNYKLKNMYE
jgi:hypothetical protein